MRNQRRCKVDSLAKTKRVGVVFGNIVEGNKRKLQIAFD